MNLQLILTYGIVIYAIAYAIYQFSKLFQPKKSACGGCNSCNLKNELKKKGIPLHINKRNLELTYIQKSKTN